MRAYGDEVARALGGLFAPGTAHARLHALHERISPDMLGEAGEHTPYSTLSSVEAFVDSIDGAAGLVAHIAARHAVVGLALENN